MPKILITGGMGFIGHHIAVNLCKRGNKVAVLDNLSRPSLNLKNPFDKSFNWKFLEQNYPEIEKRLIDVRNQKDVMSFISNYQPKIIIHAAGQTSAVNSIKNPADDFENNIVGLFNVLNCARKCGSISDFLYLSSNKVYGTKINDLPLIEREKRFKAKDKTFKGFSENTNIDQSIHTPYGISKLAGDLYVQEFGQIYDMNTTIFRLSCIYGSEQFGFLGQGWVSHMIINAIKDKPITIYGNGKQVRDILYIDDLSNLIESYITSTISLGEKVNNLQSKVYNVGGGVSNTISLLELIDKLELLLKKKISIKYKNWRLGDQKYYVSNITKINSRFGWKPNINLDEGIYRTLKWVENNTDLFN